MLTLSVRQPWAWLIVQIVLADSKDIENRDWATEYRGPLQIHAAMTCDPAEFRRAWRFCVEAGLKAAARKLREFLVELEAGRRPDIGYRGIIGRSDLVDILDYNSSADMLKPRAGSRWCQGRYLWCLDNRGPLPFRPCRGMPGLFNVDYASLPTVDGGGREQGSLFSR